MNFFKKEFPNIKKNIRIINFFNYLVLQIKMKKNRGFCLKLDVQSAQANLEEELGTNGVSK